MKLLKKYLGLLWIVLGPVILFFLVKAAVQNIAAEGKSDINQPIPWIIIIAIFIPIAIGFTIFGWYVWKGEYDAEDQ